MASGTRTCKSVVDEYLCGRKDMMIEKKRTAQVPHFQKKALKFVLHTFNPAGDTRKFGRTDAECHQSVVEGCTDLSKDVPWEDKTPKSGETSLQRVLCWLRNQNCEALSLT